jgi:tetratricopeptide (TPR) repeat protein
VDFTGRDARAVDRGLQLRAGMRGADAVIAVECRKCPELGWGARQLTGRAVRVAEAADRGRLRQCWYAEEVGALVRRMLLLLVIQAGLLLVIGVFSGVVPAINGANGETPLEALKSSAPWLGLLYAWPLVLVALLWLLRWPQLLRPAGLAVLTVTAGRGLAVYGAHLLAVGVAGVAAADAKLWMLADPVDWAIIIAGVLLWRRAGRLALDAPQILPPELQAVAPARRTWARGLLGLTAVYALAFLGFAGASRYQTSAHLLQAGVDPRREQQALLALNEGADLATRGDLAGADRALQRALPLWEGLAAGPSAPAVYRRNLAITLNDLGFVRRGQGRAEEAEKYYARAVTLADGLAGDPQADDEFKQTMDGARQALAGLRGGNLEKTLQEKEATAVRKFEEAQVKAEKGAAEAEGLYQEAIALWEEVLPQATAPDYQRLTVTRLAIAHLAVAELRLQLGKSREAEEALRRSINYGEKAVALAPDRALPKHNLEVARQMLDRQHELALQEEIDKLCTAERFADAVDAFARGVAEQEEQVRSGKDREAAARRLAYRLDRFAWFLAHCPDGRVRDPRAAVRHARRATTLQGDVGNYWYTLAMAQYRNGDWRDSLESLERVKALEGGFDATAWLLVAMNRQQLKQRAEAREALRKAVEWIDERRRQAEDNPVLRFQFEMARPTIEGLRREAEKLIEGKDPANRGVG